VNRIRSLFDEIGDLSLDNLDNTRVNLKVAVLGKVRGRKEEGMLPFCEVVQRKITTEFACLESLINLLDLE